MIVQPRLGFVGAGKVGTTLARLLYGRGYKIGGIYSQTPNHAKIFAEEVEAKIALTVDELAASCDLIFLTVTDDAVLKVVSQFGSIALEGKAVVHTSGVLDASILQPLAEQRAMIGSLHPAFPFANVEDAIARLPGATFALQAETAPLRDWLTEIVAALDGRILTIASGKKALYHTALVFVSNYGVTLYAIAQRLLIDAGAQTDEARQTLNALVVGMVQNIILRGIPDALTGPLVRGDVFTVSAHFDILGTEASDLRELYRQLAEQTLPIVVARGVDTRAVETILRRALDDADNHT